MRFAAMIAFVLCAIALAFQSTAQSATGMSGMQYYVGNWSCMGGQPKKAPVRATISYAMDGGLMREWIVAPAQKGMKTPYYESVATTYDAKHNRYVEAGMDNTGGWGVTYVTLSGDTETGVDHATADGKLGHSITHRVNNTTFTFTGYPTLTSTIANFQATCHRS